MARRMILGALALTLLACGGGSSDPEAKACVEAIDAVEAVGIENLPADYTTMTDELDALATFDNLEGARANMQRDLNDIIGANAVDDADALTDARAQFDLSFQGLKAKCR